MKVLLLNTYDAKGGAARATLRLLKGLRQSDVDQQMLVQTRQLSDRDIIGPSGTISKYFNNIRPYLDYLQPLIYAKKRTTFFPASLPDNLMSKINDINPDIVHLNWISEGFIKIESLSKIGQPLVWTLQDMWAFTGGCHYTAECERFMKSCGNCPVLNSSKENDLSRKVFNRKQKTYAAIDEMNLVAPSRWMAENIMKSALLKNFPVSVIPNGLDTSLFAPVDRNIARETYGLQADKKYILFGAIDPAGNRLKGFDQLKKAIGYLDNSETELIVFGTRKRYDLHQKIHYAGYIDNEKELAALYSAVDLMVVPSIQEAFGQTASEALSCGTPVVAFDNTGVADIVEHKKSGYLAKPFEPESLAEGINWVLSDDERLKELSLNARKRAVGKFDIKLVTGQYVTLYNKILSSQP